MGFGFNLFLFPILILVTLILSVVYLITRKIVFLKALAVLWVAVIGIGMLSVFVAGYNRPIRLTKDDIVGEYGIDKSFYPGSNADWQNERFQFEITPTDSLFFYVKENNRIIKTYKQKIDYRTGPPDLWTIQPVGELHHIIKNPPTLYRGHGKFYYVFYSELYKNMFFRKIEK